MPSARMKPGNADSMSMMRIRTSSTTPPMKPAAAPMAQPSTSPIATAAKPIVRSQRAP